MVTLVHRFGDPQLGPVWHDEVGHRPHRPDPNEANDYVSHLLQTLRILPSTAHEAADCNKFYILVYTDDESVKERYSKKGLDPPWEFGIEKLLAPEDKRHHIAVATAQQLG